MEGILSEIQNVFIPCFFTLQILNFKKIAGSSTERYRLLLSDGIYSNCYALLATKNNHLINDKSLDETCIVRVYKYSRNDMQGKIVIILLELEIINSGANVRQKIGDPISINQEGTVNENEKKVAMKGIPSKAQESGSMEKKCVIFQNEVIAKRHSRKLNAENVENMFEGEFGCISNLEVGEGAINLCLEMAQIFDNPNIKPDPATLQGATSNKETEDQEKSKMYWNKCFELLNIGMSSNKKDVLDVKIMQVIDNTYVAPRIECGLKEEVTENLKPIFDQINQDHPCANQEQLANIFDYKALIFTRLELYEEALNAKRKCYKIFKSIGDSKITEQMAHLFLIGLIHDKMGNFDLASKTFDKCFRFFSEGHKMNPVQFSLFMLSSFYIGKYQMKSDRENELGITCLESFICKIETEGGAENFRSHGIQKRWMDIVGDVLFYVEEAKQLILDYNIKTNCKDLVKREIKYFTIGKKFEEENKCKEAVQSYFNACHYMQDFLENPASKLKSNESCDLTKLYKKWVDHGFKYMQENYQKLRKLEMFRSEISKDLTWDGVLDVFDVQSKIAEKMVEGNEMLVFAEMELAEVKRTASLINDSKSADLLTKRHKMFNLMKINSILDMKTRHYKNTSRVPPSELIDLYQMRGDLFWDFDQKMDSLNSYMKALKVYDKNQSLLEIEQPRNKPELGTFSNKMTILTTFGHTYFK